MFFKQSVVLNIQICINRYFMSRTNLADLLAATYFHLDWLAIIYLRWSVPEKRTAGKIHTRDKTSKYWVVELLEHPVLWLIDLGPQNRDFYTGLIDLPKIHRIPKGMSGFWSSAETLHIKKSQKPPCLIEDPWGRRFWIFSSRIFCNDFMTEFGQYKKFTQRPVRAQTFPWLTFKVVRMSSKRPAHVPGSCLTCLRSRKNNRQYVKDHAVGFCWLNYGRLRLTFDIEFSE